MLMEAVAETTTQSPSRKAVEDLLATKTPSAGTVRALAAIAVDALAEGDRPLLEAMREGLRRRLGGWMAGAERSPDDPVGSVTGVLRVIEAAAQRLSASQVPAGFGYGTYAHRILQAIAQDPGISNSELRERLGVDETEISRTGRRLREAGLATRRRFGTMNSWTLSPVGERLLEAMPEASAIASATSAAASTELWATAAKAGEDLTEPQPLLVSVAGDRATVTALAGDQVLSSRNVKPGLEQFSQRLKRLAEQDGLVFVEGGSAADIAFSPHPDQYQWTGEVKIRGLTSAGRSKTVTVKSSEALAPLLVDGISAAIREIFQDVGAGVAGRLRHKGAIIVGSQVEGRDLLAHLQADLGSENPDLTFWMAAELNAKRGSRSRPVSTTPSGSQPARSPRGSGGPSKRTRSRQG